MGKKKTISIDAGIWNILKAKKKEIKKIGNRSITWNELFENMILENEKMKKIKEDVVRLRKLVEQIALKPTQIIGSSVQANANANAQATTLRPPPKPPNAPPNAPQKIYGQKKTTAKPPSRLPKIDKSRKGNHMKVMSELRNLFKDGKKPKLKSAKDELEKDLHKERVNAAKELIEEELKDVKNVDNIKKFMVDIYVRLQEEEKIMDFQNLFKSQIKDIYSCIIKSDQDNILTKIIQATKQDATTILSEIKAIKQQETINVEISQQKIIEIQQLLLNISNSM